MLGLVKNPGSCHGLYKLTSLDDIDSMMVPRAGMVAILTELWTNNGINIKLHSGKHLHMHNKRHRLALNLLNFFCSLRAGIHT